VKGAGSPVVLLDRDGVINVDLPTGVLRLGDLRLEPAAPAAIARFTAAGWRVAVCTNQACVGRGEVSADELARIHAAIESAVTAAGGRIDAWFVCTHRAEDRCACRKPEPGLLLQARDRFGFDPADTWFVGDAERDVEAADAAGCRPLLVRTGKGRNAADACPDVPVVDDLAAAATLLLGHAP
jgi:D-glycero-D-manno-heptose 1,7-bisphosphate phosphatase